MCWRPPSVPRALSCPLRCSPGSRRLSPRHQAGCELRGGRSQALCTRRRGRGLHAPHMLIVPLQDDPTLSRPSLSLAFMRLPVRVSVASRCPVVPHARWVHFFQIQRRGSNAQTERLAGQPLSSSLARVPFARLLRMGKHLASGKWGTRHVGDATRSPPCESTGRAVWPQQRQMAGPACAACAGSALRAHPGANLL